MRVDCRGDPLLGANRDWDCGPRFPRPDTGTVGFPKLGQDPTCERGCERQQGWLTNVPFHKRWRMQGGGTKVWDRFSTMRDGMPP